MHLQNQINPSDDKVYFSYDTTKTNSMFKCL